MTIGIISKHRYGYPARLKCFTCGLEEDSHQVGMSYSWLRFKDHVDNTGMTIRTCLACGYQSPRGAVAFGKYIYSDVIHLCVTSDGDYISSRCSMFSGSLLNGECVEVAEIDTYSYPCKRCAVDMGAHNTKIWMTEQGMEKELAFYRLL